MTWIDPFPAKLAPVGGLSEYEGLFRLDWM